MEKFQTEGRGRWPGSEDASHPRKSKKMKHTKTESSSSSEVFVERQSILLVIVVMMICTSRRGNINLMRKYQGNSKR